MTTFWKVIIGGYILSETVKIVEGLKKQPITTAKSNSGAKKGPVYVNKYVNKTGDNEHPIFYTQDGKQPSGNNTSDGLKPDDENPPFFITGPSGKPLKCYSYPLFKNQPISGTYLNRTGKLENCYTRPDNENPHGKHPYDPLPSVKTMPIIVDKIKSPAPPVCHTMPVDVSVISPVKKIKRPVLPVKFLDEHHSPVFFRTFKTF